VRARRAVNYALDRNKVVRLTPGPDAGTCQLLPPSFPGHRAYCPYTLDPGAGSGWTAPDVDEARKLVAASGTRGARVDLWWPAFYQPKRLGIYVRELLDSLGYRVHPRTFPAGTDIAAYFSGLEGRGAWHIAGSGWIADYPAASNFLNIVSCSSSANFGHFCDRAIDAKIGRALRLQEREPSAANESWAAIDRMVTDRAALGFLYTSFSADFVSKRVGNYQRHPVWGALFGQLWVR
jgi:peptide/nickel transport system substrate-binding protein